jgi:prefoldin subunit 5
MARAQNAGAELAKLERQREALRASAAELDAREKTLKRALAREGTERLAVAFGTLDLGEVSKAQAVQFAKAVAALGLAEALARLTAK